MKEKNYSYSAGEVTTYTYAGKSEGNLDNVGPLMMLQLVQHLMKKQIILLLLTDISFNYK